MEYKTYIIKAQGKKFDNENDLSQYTKELDDFKDVEKLILGGNSFGIEATKLLSSLIKDKKNLKVLYFI